MENKIRNCIISYYIQTGMSNIEILTNLLDKNENKNGDLYKIYQ